MLLHLSSNMLSRSLSQIVSTFCFPLNKVLRPCHTVQFFLQRNSTLKRCKFVTNVWYVKNILANCDRNLYLPILHLLRVELHCKLQEKLHHVTGSGGFSVSQNKLPQLILGYIYILKYLQGNFNFILLKFITYDIVIKLF